MSTTQGKPASDAGIPRSPVFVTTHWSLVVTAGSNDTVTAGDALGKLCQSYWYPLYAYVRRLGHGAHDAEDLTQEFFARLLEKNYLQSADRDKGRFRTFLLVALKRFLINEWDKGRALKRGGGQPCLSLDTQIAEQNYQGEPAQDVSPDRIYERRWALTLLAQTMARLRQEFEEDGRVKEFDQIKNFLTVDRNAIPYAEAAAAIGMSDGALRVAVHRLRKRYRDLFREEIAHTVSEPSEIEGEIRHLMNVLGEGG